MVEALDWHGCYGQSWRGEIRPEAFAHPSKFSRRLIQRIYAYLLTEGLLQAGDTVLDPFGGIGLGAADAVKNKINWVGIELEQRFVDFGGFECTGISKEDWVRCYSQWGSKEDQINRWRRANYKQGRHWCPTCLAQAQEVVEASPQLSLFDSFESSRPTASYVRDSGQIPSTITHWYAGTMDRFNKLARGGARAVLWQGDSRELVAVLREKAGGQGGREAGGQSDGVISSPPWGDVEGSKAARKFGDPERSAELQQDSHRPGTTKGAILYNMEKADDYTYGNEDGNLSNWEARETDFQAVVGSPPFAGNSGGRGEASRNGIEAGLFDRHQGAMVGGIGDKGGGNLASMQAKEGDLQAVITSPPYADGCVHTGGDINLNYVKGAGKSLAVGLNEGAAAVNYGESEGQLGEMKAGAVEGVITSPPYVESLGSDEPQKRGGLFRDPKRGGDKTLTATYGQTEGQLGRMKAGQEVEIDKEKVSHNRYSRNREAHYGYTGGQLGQRKIKDDNFWAAARLIVEQCRAVLAEGSPAVFVTKDFVKVWRRVPFSAQWTQLCEACGFELVVRIRAWMVEERGAQYDLDGDLIIKKVEHKSFFRRVTEKKGSPRIDWEDVLVFKAR